MSMASFIFYFFELVAAGCAIALIFTRQVFYAALLVITILIALAGIYIFAFAEFVAVAQLLVYAAGILVVIIIAIMLTTKLSGKPLVVENGNILAGSILGTTLFALLTYLFATEFIRDSVDLLSPVSIQKIGIELITTYALPFEIAGLILVISLIGAAVIASSDTTKAS